MSEHGWVGTESAADIANHAHALIDVGRADRAESMAQVGLAQYPNDPGLIAALVRALLVGRKAAAALTAARRLAAVAPNSWIALVWLSRAQRFASRSTGDIARNSLPAARRAVEMAPTQAETHHELGLALLDATPPTSRWLGSAPNVVDAQEAADRAIELAPDWPAAHILASAVARRSGSRKAAARHAERALELAPSDERALQAAYETAARIERRRQIASRLAFTVPSDIASSYVVATHRPSPRIMVGFGALGLAGFIMADVATFGEVAGKSASVFWVVGPAVALAIAIVLLVRRFLLLRSWDEPIRHVVLKQEAQSRWLRRATMAILAVLPVWWIPASLAGSHAGVWAFATVYAGTLMGFGARFGIPSGG